MVLNKDSILQAQDLKIVDVPVPEWGEGATIKITELSAGERVAFSEEIQAEAHKDKLYIALALTFFIVDENRNRLFTAEDGPLLAQKSITVLRRIYDEAKKLNGIGDALDAEVKN